MRALHEKRHNGRGGMTGFCFVRMRRLWSSYVIGIGAPRRHDAGVLNDHDQSGCAMG